MKKRMPAWSRAAVVGLLAVLAGGCSPKRYLVNRVGDSLANGPSVYETDDDLVLVGDALPFSLKFIETLLQQSPSHRGLLLSACKGFALYAYAWVDQPAQMAPAANLADTQAAAARARKLYLRALGYGLRGLEATHPGFGAALAKDPAGTVAVATREDVPLLYWSAAALGLAISSSRSDALMIARLPEVDALLNRALELDEAWDAGSLHEFEITLAAARPTGADPAELRKHYARALTLSEGKRASLYVTFAEAVDIKTQDRKEFDAMLAAAQAVDPDKVPALRLANTVAQRRATWLAAHVDDSFLDSSTESTDSGGATP